VPPVDEWKLNDHRLFSSLAFETITEVGYKEPSWSIVSSFLCLYTFFSSLLFYFVHASFFILFLYPFLFLHTFFFPSFMIFICSLLYFILLLYSFMCFHTFLSCEMSSRIFFSYSPTFLQAPLFYSILSFLVFPHLPFLRSSCLST
jgi:hypothetical protein